MGTMTGKGRELAEVIVERKVDIQCIQEKKWKGTTQEHRICLHIILPWRIWEQLGGEAGVIPKEDYTGRVLDGKRVSDRMILHEAGYRRSNGDCDQCVCPHVGCLVEENTSSGQIRMQWWKEYPWRREW